MVWHYIGWSRSADDLFVCFGAKPKQRPELEISDEAGSGGGKEGPREARGWVDEGRRREAVGKRSVEGSRTEKGIDRSQKDDC